MAAIALAACGGSTSPQVANTTAAPASQSQLQQDLLKYAECMRSHGVPNFPDPGSGGGFEIGSGLDRSSPAFMAAQATCRKLMPGGLLGPSGTTHPSARWLAHMVKVAECMRRNGISDFPDPRTSVPSTMPTGVGVISDIDGVVFVFPASIATQSPLFTRAAKACGFPLHNH